MRMRKKTAVIFAVLILSALACACTAREEAGKAEPSETLVIGSDIYAPYFYISDDGGFTGIDVETANEACRRMNIKPVFKKIDWQSKDEYLEKGEVDCLWGSFSMNGRESLYTWAGPYMKSRQAVVVQASSDIYSLKELNGRSIAVQNGSKPEELFLNGLVCGVTEPERIYSFSSLDTVFAALKKGYADACAGHEAALRELIGDSNGSYRVLKEPILNVRLGVAFYKGTHTELADRLSEALDGMRADGTLGKIAASYGLDPAAVIGE